MKQMTTQEKEQILELTRRVGGYDGFISPPSDWDKGDFVISPDSLISLVKFVSNETLTNVTRALWEQMDLTEISASDFVKIYKILVKF